MTCNEKAESQSGNRFLALLAGVGAGVVVGLAIAPKSGRKMRADIGDSVDDCLDSVSQKAGELRKSVINLAKRGQREVRKTTDDVADKMNDAATGAVNRVVKAGADGAYEAIDQTVDAVNAGAKKGYEAVDRAADALTAN